MSIGSFLRNAKGVHLLTNSFLFGNRRSVRGRQNRIENALLPLRLRCLTYIRGDGNRVVWEKGMAMQTMIRIIGDNNTVEIGEGMKFRTASLWIRANGAHIRLDGGNQLNNCELAVEGDGGSVLLGENTLVGGHVWLDNRPNETERTRIYAGKEAITIGADSLVSDDVLIRSLDSHEILQHGKVVNAEQPVHIGRHCWIGTGVAILKGSRIGEGCIVAARALVTRDFSERKNVILGGTPAKVIKEDIQWRA